MQGGRAAAKIRRWTALNLYALVGFGLSGLGAVQKLSLEEPIANAISIVNGEVIHMESQWDGGRILTCVTINVEEYLKGAGPNEAGQVVEAGKDKAAFISEILAIDSTLAPPPQKGQLGVSIKPAYEVFNPALYRRVEPTESSDNVAGKTENAVGGEPNPAWSNIEC